jgi:predicted RNA-binding protein (virulence factor B family)
MIELGRMNRMQVMRKNPHGFYLSEGTEGEVLLPHAEMESDLRPGQWIDVLVFRDSEDRLVASQRRPFAQAGEFAVLEVVDVDGRMGAFLNWGMPKDLLLPFREQEQRVRVGQDVLVYVGVDPETDRLVASARIARHLSKEMPTYLPNDEVDVLVTGSHDLGYQAIVDHGFRGMLYHNELSGNLFKGETFRAFVVRVREDGKVDLRRDPSGGQRRDDMAGRILDALQQRGGFLPLHDRSDPHEVRTELDMSKKAFKAGVGVLLREGRIRIEADGIHQAEPGG